MIMTCQPPFTSFYTPPPQIVHYGRDLVTRDYVLYINTPLSLLPSLMPPLPPKHSPTNGLRHKRGQPAPQAEQYAQLQMQQHRTRTWQFSPSLNEDGARPGV